MTTLWLVRHGQTDWNVAGRWQGQSAEAPLLNEVGRAQAEAVRGQLPLEQIKAVYSSDLPRARQTAEILAAGLEAPVRLDARLREINLGAWEGLPGEVVAARYADALAARLRDPAHARAPGGECAADVAARVWAAADDIAREFPEGPVVVVSHALALATIICRAGGAGLERVYEREPENAKAVAVEWAGEGRA